MTSDSVHLGDIIDIYDSRRIPLSSMERRHRKGYYPYYGASGIIDYIDDYIFDGKYLLVAEDGENLNSRKLPIAFWAEGKFWVNNHAHIILGKNGIANTNFIRFWLLSSDISAYVTGTAQPKLSQNNLKAIKISLPTLNTQRKIASILSAYDDLIENNNRRIKILEEMAQAIYKEWFVNFRFPGHENVNFVDSELGKIPEGWEVLNLYDCSEVLTGYAFKSKAFCEDANGKPVVRIRDIKNNFTKTYSFENVDDRYIIKNGDILIGMDGDFYISNWSGGKAWLNQRVARIRPKMEISRYLLKLSLERPIKFFDDTIIGTTVSHLGKKDLERINILLPDNKILNKTNNLFEPILDKKINLQLKNQNLRKTRDLLLPKLMSGEIDVEEMDIHSN